VQGNVLRPERLNVGIRDDVMNEDLGIESAEDADNAFADLPRADDADRSPGYIEAEETFEGEIAVANTRVSAMELPVQREHHPDSVLGDGVGRIGRHAGHLEPQLLGGIQIDVVIARAAQGEQLGTASDER